jgi:23S rRNA (pseudouridine1915-N3)-methyltransferase
MKLKIVKIGKPAHLEYQTLVERFHTRLKRFVNLETSLLKSYQDRDRDSQEMIAMIRKSSREYFILCDERGKDLSSPELALKISNIEQDPTIERLTFLIGGPYGLNAEVRDACQLKCRFGAGVLPSDLAWLVCTEQIYRAYCINHNISYHHE